MTAPISNEPTTTRLHHYAGHYSRSPPVPPGPSGALHTCEAWLLMCGLARRLEAQLWLSISNFARNSSMTHSNIEFASLELQRFRMVSKNYRLK